MRVLMGLVAWSLVEIALFVIVVGFSLLQFQLLRTRGGNK